MNQSKIATFTQEITNIFENGKEEHETKLTTLEISKDKEIKVNGKKMDGKAIPSSNDKSLVQPREFDGESGGLYDVAYYRETNDGVYTLKVVPEIHGFFDPDGSPRYKYYVDYSTPVVDFKRYADDVEDYKEDQDEHYLELLGALGATYITWETVVGLAVGVGSAAYLAYQMVQDYEDGSEALENANRAFDRAVAG